MTLAHRLASRDRRETCDDAQPVRHRSPRHVRTFPRREDRAVSTPQPLRKKNLHILLTEEEHKKLLVVTAHMGLEISHFIRPLLMSSIEKEIDARNLRAALPQCAQPMPLT
jgi:hypothetical protein